MQPIFASIKYITVPLYKLLFLLMYSSNDAITITNLQVSISTREKNNGAKTTKNAITEINGSKTTAISTDKRLGTQCLHHRHGSSRAIFLRSQIRIIRATKFEDVLFKSASVIPWARNRISREKAVECTYKRNRAFRIAMQVGSVISYNGRGTRWYPGMKNNMRVVQRDVQNHTL